MDGLVLLRLWVLLAALDSCIGFRVLLLNPMFAPSHFLALRTLTDNLLDRGHSVTIIRLEPHIKPQQHPNLTEIVLSIDNSNGTIPLMTHEPFARFQMPANTWSVGLRPYYVPLEGLFTVAAHCKALLSNRDRISHLRKQQFDVAIVDLLYNECSLSLAHHLELPVVGYWGLPFAGYEPMHTANINPPSTNPFILSGLPRKMNFKERLWNFLLFGVNTAIMTAQQAVTHTITQHYLPKTPHPSDLLMNISGALINAYSALDIPKQLPPSYLEVGGYHIRPTKPLPENIQNFLDNSTSGVILFSLGCTFDVDKVPKSVTRNLLAAFAQLPFKVLMRVGGKVPLLPDNVMAVKWLPQNDVLANSNIRVFITHCGMHGVLEALHHGVPMVGMPIFGDQLDISVRLQEKDLAVVIGKDSRVDQIRDAILEVATNPKYDDNVAAMKRIVHHRRVSPLESATWLVEHVAFTKGADHLKPERLHLNTLQLYCVDLILFYMVVLTALFYIPYVILTKTYYGKKKKRIHETKDVNFLIPSFAWRGNKNDDLKFRNESGGRVG